MRGGHAVTAGLLAVVILSVGVLLVLATRSGVERVGETVCPDGSRMGRLDERGASRACTIDNTEQREVEFGAVIRNPGRLPITVTDLPLEPLDRVGFTPDGIVEGAPPFRLGPDEEHRVVLRGRLPACETRTSGGATTFTSLPVRISVLGVGRGSRVPLEPAVRLVSAPC